MFTSVIIPAYNEESRIRATLDGIRDIDIINQIVVVDDGSSDGTAQVLKNYVCDKLVYAVQNPNQGKGKALEKGLELADKSADVIVFLDADLGQRAFKKEVISKFDHIPEGYGVEVGMTIDILKWGYRIKEVTVDMTHNETGRDLSGFIHRGKQYLHIKRIVKEKKREWR